MITKDYERLVKALWYQKPGLWPGHAANSEWAADIRALADALASDNPRFDRTRFYTAGGIKGSAKP